METMLDMLLVVAIFIIGILFGYGLGLDKGEFKEMQRQEENEK
jgi:hypothetical protein